MAKVKTTKKKAVAAKVAQPKAEMLIAEFSPSRHINVNLTRTINLGNYESVKIGVGLSTNVEDDADLDEAFKKSFAEAEMAFKSKLEEMDLQVSEPVKEEEEEESEEEESEEEEGEEEEGEEEEGEEEEDEEGEEEWEEEEEEEDDDVTEEDIRGMNKKALLKLIKDEELEVKASKYKKLADLQNAIIAELFEEEEEEEEEEEAEGGEDWDDEAWDDDDD